MDSRTEIIKDIQSRFNEKMNSLFVQKKALIKEFTQRLEVRKIRRLKEEILQK